jgi:branched-subunit amino acid transport protein
MNNTYVYIAVMFITSYLVRVLPLTVFRRSIQSRFVRSFLYYVPYVTLSLMTFPAIVEATRSPLAGALALAAGIAAAWLGAGLLPVAVICCAVVLIAEGLMI